MIAKWKEKWIKSDTVKEIYQARWVWYHTLLAIELGVIILLQFAVLITLISQ